MHALPDLTVHMLSPLILELAFYTFYISAFIFNFRWKLVSFDKPRLYYLSSFYSSL